MPTRKQIADYLNKLERAQFRGETSYANKVQREKNRLTRYLSEYYSENGVLNDNDAEIYAHAENLIELEEQEVKKSIQTGLTITGAFFLLNYQNSKQLDVIKQSYQSLNATDLARNYISQFGLLDSKSKTSTVLLQVRGVIDRGIRDGLSEREIGRQIRSVMPNINALQARTIARTETHKAFDYAQEQIKEETQKITGDTYTKEWITARDEFVRSSHIPLDGIKKEENELFDVGGEKALRPRDPGLSAKESINCRCALVYIPIDEQSS